MNRFLYIPVLFFCCLLSSCAQERIIDQIRIIQAIGLDIEGENIKISASYPSYKSASQKSLLTAESKSINENFTIITTESSQPVEIGQMRTLVLSEQYARKGISEIADIINQESLKSGNATIVISKQTASSIISETFKKPPYFLSELIEQNMHNGNTPKTNYHSFVNQYYGEGQDVYLPAIKKDKGLLHMVGIGVFKEDKLKLWLTNKEGLYIKLLKEKALTGTYEFTTGQKEKYSIIILSGKRKIAMQNEKAAISLKLTVQLREFPTKINILQKEVIFGIKKKIEGKLASEIEAMLVQLQKNNVDTIGFGEQFRKQNRHYNQNEFDEKIYPKMVFDVNAEVIILHSGVGH
ncbi:Ger(x)C family spore germination protein [Cohnella luojiensis]|nr:Ger(x)C family spore germination protein [Cohnella luojiensis]